MGFYFCLRFRRHFFRHTDFIDFKIFEFFFFKIQILRFHRKMCGLFPCIPILRWFFLRKSAKQICMCDWVTNHIATCEKYFFRFKWGYKRISGPGSPKTYCFQPIFSALWQLGGMLV